MRRHAERLEVVMAGELHRQITGKPVRTFDEDHAHAVAGDPIEHGSKARTFGHNVGAGHAWVIELVNERVRVGLGESLDDAARWRLSLSLSAPTLAADDVRR